LYLAFFAGDLKKLRSRGRGKHGFIANRYARVASANTHVVPPLEAVHIPDTFARVFLPSPSGDKRGFPVHSIRASRGVRDHNNGAVDRHSRPQAPKANCSI
jgi:hypothetical protein